MSRVVVLPFIPFVSLTNWPETLKIFTHALFKGLADEIVMVFVAGFGKTERVFSEENVVIPVESGQQFPPEETTSVALQQPY